MVVIPSGSFVMGVPAGEEKREGLFSMMDLDHAIPQHRVTIAYSFSLGRYEVTRAQFAAFVEATGYSAGNECFTLAGSGSGRDSFAVMRRRDWRNPGFTQTANDPVVCVSWRDAQAYVDWLKKATGKSYRLPSEAEWEYAARAGTRTARHWGDGRDEACLYANAVDLTAARHYGFENKPDYSYFSCADGYVHTAPVGSFRPNAFGLHDMLGNAWEWTGDCWNETYNGAPTNGDVWAAGDCTFRVRRGGSWFAHPAILRAGGRSQGTLVSRSSYNGFRVARGN
jgi:formylglycine-generating enzyme required for sulfatase activity